MGQKHTNGKHKLKRSDTVKNLNKKSMFDDAVDLEDEFEILKIGTQKSIKCPICKNILPTNTDEEKKNISLNRIVDQS